MTELLTGADPYGDRPNPTVRDVLDAGAARVQTELAGEPEVLAEMLTVIGRVYQRFEIFDKAQPLLEQALALGRGVGGPEHPRVAQTLNDLGVLMRMNGNAAASVKMLDESLAMRRRLLGQKHKDVAVTLSELGRSYDKLGQRERAEGLARDALAMRRELLGEDHRETATSRGRHRAAALAARRSRGGRAHAASEPRDQQESAGRPPSQRELRDVQSGTGRSPTEATTPPRKHYFARRSRCAAGRWARPMPAWRCTLNNLAYPLREQGKYDEAVAALEEALGRCRWRQAATDSPTVAHYRANLARVYLAKGDAAVADAAAYGSRWPRACARSERNDWRVGMTKSLLGSALTSLKHYDEAEPLLLDAQRLLKDVPGAQGREANATMTRLRVLYEAWGRPDKAARGSMSTDIEYP